jgi:hypothetical protein
MPALDVRVWERHHVDQIRVYDDTVHSPAVSAMGDLQVKRELLVEGVSSD